MKSSITIIALTCVCWIGWSTLAYFSVRAQQIDSLDQALTLDDYTPDVVPTRRADTSTPRPSSILNDTLFEAPDAAMEEPDAPLATPLSLDNLSTTRRIAALRQRILKAGKENAERKKLVGELRQLMESVFDADYARREREVVKLENRVAKLRKSLDRRQSAKERIIGVRIDSLLLEADGLGFPQLDPQPDQPMLGGFRGNLATPLHDDFPVNTSNRFRIRQISELPDGNRSVVLEVDDLSETDPRSRGRVRRVGQDVTGLLDSRPTRRTTTVVVPHGVDMNRYIQRELRRSRAMFVGQPANSEPLGLPDFEPLAETPDETTLPDLDIPGEPTPADSSLDFGLDAEPETEN